MTIAKGPRCAERHATNRSSLLSTLIVLVHDHFGSVGRREVGTEPMTRHDKDYSSRAPEVVPCAAFVLRNATSVVVCFRSTATIVTSALGRISLYTRKFLLFRVQCIALLGLRAPCVRLKLCPLFMLIQLHHPATNLRRA
jgi:hypothetical protein